MQIIYSFDSKFKKKFDEALKIVGDLETPLSMIALNWYRSNRFLFQGKPGRYIDLSEKYKKQKKKIKQKLGLGSSPYPVLVLTGRLRDSMLSPEHPDAIYHVSKNELNIGTKVPYGYIHQYGSSKKNIPPRPFLVVGAEQTTSERVDDIVINRWINIIENYVGQKLGNV